MFDLRRTLISAVMMISATGLALAQSGDLHTGVDALIKPGDDFYAYANNEWLHATALPEGVARIDSSALLRVENARRVRDLIEAAATPSTTRTLSQKIGDYYATWLDTAAIDARGLTPLAGDLAAIAAINDRRALATYLGRTMRLDDGTNTQTESLWGVWIHTGFHDPDHYAAHIVQGGLVLPVEDYLDPSPEHAAHRTLYAAHIANVLRLAGFDQTDARAERIVALEIAIAQTHASRADTDDVFKTDNSWSRADFAARAPGVDWDAYLAAAGLNAAPSFVVWQPQAVIGGSRLVASESLDAWKDYLAFHLIEHEASVLPAAVANARRDFDAQLAGAPTPSAPDRAPQAIAATTDVLGDGIGQMYVARYFSPQARAAVTTMVQNIRIAFRARLQHVAWMAPATRTLALAKLDALRIGLGYPGSWIDYTPLQVIRGDAYGNFQRAEAFTYQREVAKLDRRVDPDEWPGGLHPQMVGAILNLSPNSMQFGAGLFQPPYFNPIGDAASNYGSAGAGLSHEISHSFDEVTNMYDVRGRLVRWWTPEDLTRYRAAIAPLAAQLSACCPQPNRCANGDQMLGESSADLVGLEVAHDAYLLSLRGRPDAVVNGLTGEQRFFIAFAQRWRRQQTDADLAHQIATDTHAIPSCRADLVRNSDAWTRAFNVQRGDRLYLDPDARVHAW